MKLIYSPTSPFVRKVSVLLREAGLLDRVQNVPVTVLPTKRDDVAHSHNPLGKVPALILDDGTVLVDSPVVCEYLASLAPGSSFFPADASRWAVLSRAAIADGVMDAAILVRYEGFLRPEPHRWQEWIDGQKLKMNQSLDALEAGQSTAEGPVTIADITVGAMLGYLDFRYPELGWRERCPKLKAFDARFSQRPSMVAPRPPPA